MPNAVGSRRERPAKPALSRDWIVAEAIRIMRAEGLEKVTMRRLAQTLDTGPSSLYVYVANMAELHAAVLDELVGSVDLTASGDWQARLEKLLGDYSAVLFAYPGLARSALALRPTGANLIRLYDQVLGLLLEGGIPAGQAAWGLDLLLQHVTANAAEHSVAAPGDTPAWDDDALDGLAVHLRTVDPRTAPHVAAHAGALLAGTPLQRGTWALRAVIAGIAATPTPAGIDA